MTSENAQRIAEGLREHFDWLGDIFTHAEILEALKIQVADYENRLKVRS